MGAKPAKPMEGRGWPVSGRQPYFVKEQYWKEEQEKLEPYMVQGKGRPLRLKEAMDRCRVMGLKVVPQSFTHTYTAGGLYEQNRFVPSFPDTGTMDKVPVLFHNDVFKVDFKDSPFKVKVIVGDEDMKTIIEWELIQEATKAKANNIKTPNLGCYDEFTYRDEPLQFKDNQPSKSCNLADPEATWRNQEPQPRGEWKTALLDDQVYIRDKKESKVEKKVKMLKREEDKENKRNAKMEAGRLKKGEKQVREKEEEKYKKKLKKNKSKGRSRKKSEGRKGREQVDHNSCPTLDSMAKVRNTSLCFT